MTKEFGYVYILTNPSMPGLVKVGKTTITPNKRMIELHSTGVPTPFFLEFSVSVIDCHSAEISAHQALKKFRVTKNREFFKISPKKAIEIILETVNEYQVVDFRESHGIEEIELAIEQKRKIKAAEEERKQFEFDSRKREQESKNRTDQRKLLIRLQELQLRLKSYGEKPKELEGGIWTLFSICYMPIPFGWIFWLGSLQIFDSKKTQIGYFCLGLLVTGYFAYKSSKKIEAQNEQLLKPFYEIETEILTIEEKLQATGYKLTNSLQNNSNKNKPEKFQLISKESVVRESFEMPRSISETRRSLQGDNYVLCPTCKNRVDKKNSGFEFKCLSCGNAFRY